jgi:hypothetical protein
VADHVSDSLDRVDAPATDADLYRRLTSAESDEADAVKRPGPPINLQSIVTRFDHQGTKVLFAGDMQFADPQLNETGLAPELKRLRARVRDGAPYSLVKLSHHGSDNAFDAALLGELGATPLYGICAGENSTHHPNTEVLSLLESQKDRLKWVRTDRNGRVTIAFNGDSRISPAHGRISDPRPNSADAPPPAVVPRPPIAVPVSPVVPVGREGREASGASRRDDVEVVTRIPPGVERVSLTIEVGRSGPSTGEPAKAIGRPDRVAALGGGRPLPPLLFVTSRERLASNIGEVEAAQVLDSIRDAGAALCDGLTGHPDDAVRDLALVHDEVDGLRGIEGIVLIGGHDVVPSRRLDCLPPSLRQRLGSGVAWDADNFMVWSDDRYGDRDDDLIPELAVSRIPDGKSADLVRAALATENGKRRSARRGVRNVLRPFAESVFDLLPGNDALSVSEETTPANAPPLDAEFVYLMLHGDAADSSRFWGEHRAGYLEAVNLNNVPRPGGRVVFTGCCWGALITDQPAARALPGTVPAPKTVGSSMALAFLEQGATAFVGCTGTHYSPQSVSGGYYGGPMHAAFWKKVAGGTAPAPALFEAKRDYALGFPHGRSSPEGQAIEYKILRQYTCLGLGW